MRSARQVLKGAMKRSLSVKRLLYIPWCLLVCVFSSQAGSDTDIHLQRTSAAPEGASGVATFEKEGNGAAVAATVQQLGAGTYELRAVRKSDRSAVVLGTIVVADPTLAPDRNTSDNKQQLASIRRTRHPLQSPPAAQVSPCRYCRARHIASRGRYPALWKTP